MRGLVKEFPFDLNSDDSDRDQSNRSDSERDDNQSDRSDSDSDPDNFFSMDAELSDSRKKLKSKYPIKKRKGLHQMKK
jgi:hypothetical protein